jgi:hypothetical protein
VSNVDLILSLVRAHAGLTDAELRRRSGVDPHQQVNQICRGLEKKGLIRRERTPSGRIVNVPVAGGEAAGGPVISVREPMPGSSAARPRSAAPATPALDGRALLVVQCSGSKAQGGERRRDRPSILDLLTPSLADRLRDARRLVAVPAELDERRVLPAWRRYTGHFYTAAGERLARAVQEEIPMVILSGGYGLLLPTEPIGTYRRRLSLRDWPPGLLEECLLAFASELKVDEVVAFCSASTNYAKLLRRTRWSEVGIAAHLGSPDPQGRGGAQVAVPRAAGEAFRAFLDGRLAAAWRSQGGLAMTWGDSA